MGVKHTISPHYYLGAERLAKKIEDRGNRRYNNRDGFGGIVGDQSPEQSLEWRRRGYLGENALREHWGLPFRTDDRFEIDILYSPLGPCEVKTTKSWPVLNLSTKDREKYDDNVIAFLVFEEVAGHQYLLYGWHYCNQIYRRGEVDSRGKHVGLHRTKLYPFPTPDDLIECPDPSCRSPQCRWTLDGKRIFCPGCKAWWTG